MFFSFEPELFVCPKHRYSLGIYWRPKKTCVYPSHLGSSKPQTSITVEMSQTLFSSTGTLFAIGSGICRRCLDHYKQNYANEKSQGHTADPVISTASETGKQHTYSLRDRDSSMSYDKLAENLFTFDESQSSVTVDSSQCSNWSDCIEPSVTLEEFNSSMKTLSKGSVSPLRFQLNKRANEADPRTIRYLKRKAEQSLDAIVEAMAPGQGGELLKLIKGDNADYESQKDFRESELLATFVTIYCNTEDNRMKNQVLSMISDKMSKSEMLEMIPGLTKWRVDQSRLHAAAYGPGFQTVSKEINHRQNMDPVKMNHALSFFSDPNFISPCAVGTKELHLDSGETLKIPEVVRTVCHSALVDLYLTYCKEIEFSPLGRSTLYNILNACSASKRTSLRGLDNISTDGAAAYDDIIKLVDKLGERGIPIPAVKIMKTTLINSKRYLKTEYKIHISRESDCADHCIQYALSDPNQAEFIKLCAHVHRQCVNCNLIGSARDEITGFINQVCRTDEKLECLKELDDAMIKIEDWKSHILRVLNQDLCRFDVLESLLPNQVFVIMDWAMKYLPAMYREPQSSWYAQKGMSWHGSVCIFRDLNGNLKHWTYTHLMDNVKQDWFAVASILEHTLITVKSQLPAVDTAFLRSDIAGCYHCAYLWLALPGISERTGVIIKNYSYSEPAAGKSYCDAKFAHMRSKMRSFVSSGNNIKSPHDMKVAIDSGLGVAGCQTAVIDINSKKQTLHSHTWKNVSQINNLEFTSEGIIVWRAYKIGDGLLVSNNKLSEFAKQKQQNDCLPTVIDDFKIPGKGSGNIASISNSEIHKKDVQEISSEDEEAIMEDETESGHAQSEIEFDSVDVDIDTSKEITAQSAKLFYCPEPGCIKMYQYCSYLENHLLTEKHEYHSESTSSYNIIKVKWAESCNQMSCSGLSGNTDSGVLENRSTVLGKGWALKKEKKAKQFSKGVKDHLNIVFQQGESCGKKANPSDVAREIRSLRLEDGSHKFQPHEWLQPSQIASFFSRLSLQYRKGKQSKDKQAVDFNVIDDEDLMAVLNELEYTDTVQQLQLTG